MATVKRLIDARYLTSQMYLICEACQTENIFIDAIIDEIDNAPDVDAVEVVRCKDCQHCDMYQAEADHSSIPICMLHSFEVVDANGFCYRGERKDNAV